MPEAGGSRRPVQGGVRARARLATAGPADRPGGRGSTLGRGLRRAHLRRRRQDVLGQRPAGAGAAPPRQVTPWGSMVRGAPPRGALESEADPASGAVVHSSNDPTTFRPNAPSYHPAAPRPP